MQQSNEPSPPTPEPRAGGPGIRFAYTPPDPAADRKDWPTLIAIVGVCVGWFFLDAVALRAGHFISSYRFYDLAAIMYRPSRLITGSRDSDWWLTVPFFVVCTAAIAATLAPRFSRHRAAWFGLFAPLALMVVSCIVLYQQSSKDLVVASPDSSEVARAFANLAHAITRKTGAVLSQHLSPGAGMWVSAIGSVYLAVIGWRRLRASDAVSPSSDNALHRN